MVHSVSEAAVQHSGPECPTGQVRRVGKRVKIGEQPAASRLLRNLACPTKGEHLCGPEAPSYRVLC
jgi:hypothetical protein